MYFKLLWSWFFLLIFLLQSANSFVKNKVFFKLEFATPHFFQLTLDAKNNSCSFVVFWKKYQNSALKSWNIKQYWCESKYANFDRFWEQFAFLMIFVYQHVKLFSNKSWRCNIVNYNCNSKITTNFCCFINDFIVTRLIKWV